jgi:hypothetical protein
VNIKMQAIYKFRTLSSLLICLASATAILASDSIASNIKKKDGTVDQRINDLDELCKDWVYYKAKILKYSKEGDEKAAAKARSNFVAVNKDLSEYHDKDVTTTCAKYDTQENIQKYLK